MPQYKGNRYVYDRIIQKNASSDKYSYEKETYRGLEVDAKGQYERLVQQIASQPDKRCMAVGTSFIESVNWEKSQQAGYETLTIIRGKKLAPECCSCCNKVTSYTASVSLQQVALIEHKKFKWILNRLGQSTILKYCACGTSYEQCVNLATAIQDYVSMQTAVKGLEPERYAYQRAVESYLSSSAENPPSTSSSQAPHDTALLFANKLIAGVQYFLAPQATISINKSMRKKELFSVGGGVGKRSSAPGKFSSWDCSWDFLYSGASIQYNENCKSGIVQETYIGMPKSLGGGWDSDLYNKC